MGFLFLSLDNSQLAGQSCVSSKLHFHALLKTVSQAQEERRSPLFLIALLTHPVLPTFLSVPKLWKEAFSDSLLHCKIKNSKTLMCYFSCGFLEKALMAHASVSFLGWVEPKFPRPSLSNRVFVKMIFCIYDLNQHGLSDRCLIDSCELACFNG